MAEQEGATKAKEALSGTQLGGRQVRVDYSLTAKPHDSTPGQYMGRREQGMRNQGGRGGGYGGGNRYGGGGYGGDRDRPRDDRPYDDRRRSRSR